MASVKLSKRIDEKLRSASEQLGFDEHEIIERAILFYLDAIEKRLDFNRELKEWDKLSDEALANFETIL